jgi:hypothetical protein
MSPERVTNPEQGESSGGIATFSLWTRETETGQLAQLLDCYMMMMMMVVGPETM